MDLWKRISFACKKDKMKKSSWDKKKNFNSSIANKLWTAECQNNQEMNQNKNKEQ